MSKRELAARFLAATRLGMVLNRLLFRDGLIVLNYHRIGDPAATPFDPDLFSATADDFDRQLRFFKQHFDIVGTEDLSRISGARGRYLLITFDDGYRDNYAVAFPILRQHKLPATFFVATGYLDQPRIPWWDELAWMIERRRADSLTATTSIPFDLALRDPVSRSTARRRLNTLYQRTALDAREALLDRIGDATGSGRCPADLAGELWMTWPMVREMQSGGMAFGAHTVNHVELSRLSREQQREEITHSKSRLETELSRPCRAFSYPFGARSSFDMQTRDCLATAGFDHAFSYYGGYQRPAEWDRYDMQRIAVETHTSWNLLSAMLAVPQLFARPTPPAMGVVNGRSVVSVS